METSIDEREVELITLMLQRAVSEMSAEACEQCGVCPSACPVARHMETFNPRRMIAKISLGQIEELLKSPEIWTCTSCLKCKERCPENISPYDVILVLRNLAVRAGYPYPEGYDDFVKNVLDSGMAQQPQAVRTRGRQRRDRESLGLPPAQRPRDMEAFSEILEGIVKAGRSA